MKNINAIFAVTALAGVVASSSVSADDVSSVVANESFSSVVDAQGVSRQVEFAPVTIQDYIERARSESDSNVNVDSGSIVIKGWEDILGEPVKI